MSSFSVNQIVGTPDSIWWSQVHHFSGLEKKKLSKRGEMVLILSLEGSPEEAATALGREIISRIHEEYYGNLDDTPMNRLRITLEKIGQEKPIYLSQKIDLSLVTLVFWNEVVYLGVWGQGRVLISRDGEIGELIKNSSQSAKVISGQAREEDLFLMGTGKFFSQLPSGTIMASLQTGKPSTIVEILSPLVHARKDQGAIGAAVVSIDEIDIDLSDSESLPPSLNQDVLEIKPEPEIVNLPSKKTFLPGLKSTFSKRKRLLLGLFQKLPKLKAGRRRKEIFVKTRGGEDLAKRRMTLTLAGGFLILLVVSIFFGWQKKQERENEKRFTDLYSKAEKKLVSAESIRSLDPEESLNLLDHFFELISETKSLKTDSSTENLEKRAESLKTLLGGGERKAPDLFFNLNLITDGSVGTSLFVDEETVYVLDSVSKRIFSISWPQKKTSTIALGNFLADDRAIYASGQTVYLLGEKGIVELEGEDGVKELIKPDWQKLVNFSRWGGNFYLLDSGEEKLWKYPKTSLGYTQRTNWFSGNPSFNWKKVVDFDIDGRIWVLTLEGKIYKFFAGQSEEYSQKSTLVAEADFLSVSADSDRLVFWDKGDKDVWVLTKSGELVVKIPLKVDEVFDLSITPDGSKIFLLSKATVYWIDLSGYTL